MRRIKELPVAVWLKQEDTLCYSAYLKGGFDKEKGRITKGDMMTSPIKGRKGGWEDNAFDAQHNAVMMRCGPKPAASGFIAVDIDTRHDETGETVCPTLWNQLEPLCRCIVRTPSNGVHMYWRLPAGKSWTKELNFKQMVLGGVEHDTKGQVDILADGGGIILPGSTFKHQGVEYEYEYMKGCLADADEVPQILADFFNTRPIMTGTPAPPSEKRVITLKKPASAAPLETAPSAPTAPAPPAQQSRSSTPVRVSDADITLIDKLCECLTPEWLEKYTNWRDLVFCLKAVTQGSTAGLHILQRHTTRSPRHKGPSHLDATSKLYVKADVRGSIGWGSLHYWARGCNPEAHHRLFKDNYNNLIREGNRGLADILATELAGSCVYDANEKCFWLFVEHLTLWKRVSEDNIVAQYMRRIPVVIGKIISGMPLLRDDATEEDKDIHKEKMKHLIRLRAEAQNNCPEATLKCLRDLLNPEVSWRNIDPFEPDANPDFLPLSNGVWNFKEGKLEDYSRQHYITKKLPIDYNDKADMSNIQEAMRLWFKGNKEHIDFVQYWFGYCLTGHITRQDFIILFGKSAGNGKSTFVEEILQEDILGRHFATTLGEDALSRVGGNNDDLYYAFGKRLAIAPESGGESKDTKALHLPTLKRITGGGRVAAEAKFKGKKEGIFNAKVVCICNEMPKMPTTIDNGTRRRTNVLEMNTKFLYPGEWEALSEEERTSGDFGLRNPAFIRTLRANREGTLLWLLQGAQRYMANPEMDAPESVKRYTAEALAKADEEREWFKAGWEFDKVKCLGQEVSVTEICAEWHDAFGIPHKNMVARGKFINKLRLLVGDKFMVGDTKHGFTIRCCRRR